MAAEQSSGVGRGFGVTVLAGGLDLLPVLDLLVLFVLHDRLELLRDVVSVVERSNFGCEQPAHRGERERFCNRAPRTRDHSPGDHKGKRAAEHIGLVPRGALTRARRMMGKIA